MNVTSKAQVTHQAAKEENKASSFNIYPLLGVALMIVLAVLVYGGLVVVFFEEWFVAQPAVRAALPK